MSAIHLRVFLLFLTACHALGGSVRFLAVEGGGDLPGIGIRTAKGLVEVDDLGPLKRSAAYQLPKGHEDLLLEAAGRKRADGKPASLTMPIDSAMKSPLVLILADAAAETGFRAVLVDDDPKSFPKGTCRFFNSSKSPFTLRFGTKTETLAENGASLDLRPEGEAKKLGVQLTKPDAPETILYSAVWQNEPEVRKLVIIADGSDPQTAPVEVRILPDTPAGK
jgi:hypothetical protein